MDMHTRLMVYQDGGDQMVVGVLGRAKAEIGDEVSMFYDCFNKCANPKVEEVIEQHPQGKGWFWAKVRVNETREWMRGKSIQNLN